MTSPTAPRSPTTLPGRRHATFATAVLAAALVALSACGIGGQPVDAAIAASAPGEADCPEWAAEILAGSNAGSDVDVDGLADHYRERAVVLDRIADRLPTEDAEIVQAYADAVDEFADGPLSAGVSRRMGETAADAAVLAARSC